MIKELIKNYVDEKEKFKTMLIAVLMIYLGYLVGADLVLSDLWNLDCIQAYKKCGYNL